MFCFRNLAFLSEINFFHNFDFQIFKICWENTISFPSNCKEAILKESWNYKINQTFESTGNRSTLIRAFCSFDWVPNLPQELIHLDSLFKIHFQAGWQLAGLHNHMIFQPPHPPKKNKTNKQTNNTSRWAQPSHAEMRREEEELQKHRYSQKHR